MEVVGLARDGLEACDLVEKLRPDLLLLDIRMPAMDGIEALKRIKQARPETCILILTTFIELDYIVAGLANGANSREIADELYIAEGTVRNYISHFYGKLDLILSKLCHNIMCNGIDIAIIESDLCLSDSRWKWYNQLKVN